MVQFADHGKRSYGLGFSSAENLRQRADTMSFGPRHLQEGQPGPLNLIGEFEAATSGVEVFRKLGEYMAAPEEKGIDKPHDAYSKAINQHHAAFERLLPNVANWRSGPRAPIRDLRKLSFAHDVVLFFRCHAC